MIQCRYIFFTICMMKDNVEMTLMSKYWHKCHFHSSPHNSGSWILNSFHYHTSFTQILLIACYNYKKNINATCIKIWHKCHLCSIKGYFGPKIVFYWEYFLLGIKGQGKRNPHCSNADITLKKYLWWKKMWKWHLCQNIDISVIIIIARIIQVHKSDTVFIITPVLQKYYG